LDDGQQGSLSLDPTCCSSLGCWSYIKLQGSNNIKYAISSGYHIGPKQPKLGAHTVYNQQYHILLSKGHTTPNPCQQFINDLVQQVKQWRQQQIKVLICLNGNEDVKILNPMQPSSLIALIIAEPSLSTSFQHLHNISMPPLQHTFSHLGNPSLCQVTIALLDSTSTYRLYLAIHPHHLPVKHRCKVYNPMLSPWYNDSVTLLSKDGKTWKYLKGYPC